MYSNCIQVDHYGRNGFHWSATPPSHLSFRGSNYLYHASGPTPTVQSFHDPMQFFLFFFDSTFREHVLHCTNKRLPLDIEPITEDEFIAFMGILYLCGVTRRNKVDTNELWSNQSPHYLELASLAMPRNRFGLIMKHLSFYDVSRTYDKNDKFFKVRDSFQSFQEKIRNAYEPSGYLCVDEELYPFRGKCTFRQYIPTKPGKYGIKYWCLADCSSAYLCNVDVYLGKQERRATNVAQTVVTTLIHPFRNHNRNVTMDNFFTSMPLAKSMWENKFTLLG